MSKTFCILPWKHLAIRTDGAPYLCCAASESVSNGDGQPMSVYEHSLEEIWNSPRMRQIRQDMLEGRKVAPCALCYRQEEAGHGSPRLTANEDWSLGWLNEDCVSLAQLSADSAAHDHCVPAPRSLELYLGNLCNLKCRMCNARSSSRIARDPVHRHWSRGGNPRPHGKRAGGRSMP